MEEKERDPEKFDLPTTSGASNTGATETFSVLRSILYGESVPTSEMNIDEPMESDIDEDDPTLAFNAKNPTPEESGELINKFLSGHIDFSQYAQQMSVSTSYVEDSDNEEVSKPDIKDIELKLTEEEASTVKKTKRAPRKPSTVRSKIPPALKGLIGEANVCYARGDKETAIDMCLEVIRLHPQASEPFFTLSHIYEDSGESDKAMQMSLIGAHLNPGNKEIWLQLADKSEKIGDLKQAMTCYTQALRKDWCLELLAKRGECQLKLGDKKMYFANLQKMAHLARSTSQYDQELEICKKIAEFYHDKGDYEMAKESLGSAFNNCSKHVKFEHINLYLELLIMTRDFAKCLEVLVEHCGIEFEADVNDEHNSIHVINISIPSDMMVDILAKLVIALVLMKSNHLFDQIFPHVLKVDPNDAGDLYLDIAETLIAEKLYADALKFLDPLTTSENFSLPAVWVRKAECQAALEMYRDAIAAYEVVLEKVPLHNDARLALVDLLTKLGEKENAIQVLSYNIHEEEMDLKLTFEKCLLLKTDRSKEKEFIHLAELILSRHLEKIRNLDEKAAVAQLRSPKHRLEAIPKIRKLRNEPLENDDVPIFIETDETPTNQQEFDLYVDLCNVYIRNKSFRALQRLTFSALLSRKFYNIPELSLHAFLASFYCQDGVCGFDFGRVLLNETNFESGKIWNLISVMFDFIDHQRVYKYLTRLTSKMQGNQYISQLKANTCLLAHIAHKFALNDFALLYRKNPENPLLAFLTALCFFQLVCQKYSNKHLLFTQGLAFLSKYIELREEESKQEVHYNIGRVFHQLSLFPFAVHHYKLALENEPVIKPDITSLKREIAYNLHLIYLQSGEVDLARSLIEEYVVV